MGGGCGSLNPCDTRFYYYHGSVLKLIPCEKTCANYTYMYFVIYFRSLVSSWNADEITNEPE